MIASLLVFWLAVSPSSIIPRPVSVEEGNGVFECPEAPTYRIVGRAVDIDGFRVFLEEALPGAHPASKADITFRMGVGTEGSEGYVLKIKPGGITVESEGSAGAFYALQSLLQLLSRERSLQCAEVRDRPRYGYRAFMIDVSRVWYDVDFIKRQLDEMARLKMNVFHFHLTDDTGWRIQIDAYPELTRRTAWRYGVEHIAWVKAGAAFAEPGAPGAVGGFYTKDDIREIVSYAAARHIEVIPEIDMPGHCYAVVKAYPEYACTTLKDRNYGERYGDGRTDFCLGAPGILDFAYTVIDEVAELFPSPYFHMGGDEAVKKNWHDCTRCKALREAEGLADEDAMQDWFTTRLAGHLMSIGKIPMGWSEVAGRSIPKDVVVVNWLTDDPVPGHKTVLTPHRYTYFCFCQDAPGVWPKCWSRYLPLDMCYAYEPASGENVMGIEACLWTSTFTEGSIAEFMTYPRLAAIAERAWSQASVRDYANFRDRVVLLGEGWERRGVNYFDIRKEFGHRRESLDGAPDNMAAGCSFTCASPVAPRYASSRPEFLLDGLFGDWNCLDGRWVGFNGVMDVTIDLGAEKDIRYVGAVFAMHPSYSDGLPGQVRLSLSTDGLSWSEPLVQVCPVAVSSARTAYVPYQFFLSGKARYVRYTALSEPNGEDGLILTDEILVR